LIGKTLAHYEIVSMLGKGGMGEVYRARDPRLGRDVALKVLPADLANDAERLARFDREARTLATLQHPNIASIYGFEEDEGQRFLVMELVEGRELAEVCQAGKIDLDETLRIGLQIATALEAAHETGIVHRDLKPANIMLTGDGTVKVLDFGLARAYAPEETGEVDLANSPTITAAMTHAGTILGTAAYMSPEQAKGRHLDRRADVWAFGVIVFEMLSGERLFEGETVSDTLAAVLRAEPDYSRLPKNTPAQLVRLLRRCLNRDPRERLRDAGDARLMLQEVIAGPRESVDAVTRKSSRAPLYALGALAVALALTLVAVSMRPASMDLPAVEFDVNPPIGYAWREFSLAPDGSALVVVGTSRVGHRSLWLRRMDDSQLRELPGTLQATFPFWSADSRSIGFFAGGNLLRIDLANENVRRLAPAPNGRGGAWSPEGYILFTPEGSAPLYRIPPEGGTPEAVTSLDEGSSTHRFPHFTDDGSGFTYSDHGSISHGLQRYFQKVDGGPPVRLPDGMSESYPVGRNLFFVQDGDLVAQPFDPATGQLSGEPLFLAPDVPDVFPRTARSAFSVADNGVLAWLTQEKIQSRFNWYGSNGLVEEAGIATDAFTYPEVSDDGRYVVFYRLEAGVTGSGDLWVHDLERGTSRRVITGSESNGHTGWAEGDRSVIFNRDGNMLVQDLDGGAPEVLIDVAASEHAAYLDGVTHASQARDGSYIVFAAWDPNTDFDLWMVPRGESSPVRMIDEPALQADPRISPDSRWVAYVSGETGRGEIYVCRATPQSIGMLVSTDGGRNPMWSEDGETLYYISAEGYLTSVSISEASDRLAFGLPKPLFRAPAGPPDGMTDTLFPTPYLMAARGGRFLFQELAEEIPARAISVTLDWERRLGRRD
jgi:Tol biopolymer transport system component/predicted Ser/Thr protein kinase